jgi:hypothetical protein
MASEYFVLSQLYRLGHEAYLTLGNNKSVDIRVVYNNMAVSVDVKAVRGYSSLIINNVHIDTTHFIVFVIYNEKFEDLTSTPEVYVVPSTMIPSIEKVFKDQRRVFKSDITSYKDNWKCLFNQS